MTPQVIDSQVTKIEPAQPSMLEIARSLIETKQIPAESIPALMSQMFDFQMKVKAVEAEQQFNIDMAAAMAEMPTITKDAKKDMGVKGSIPYATYENLDAIVRQVEQKYGFCRIFTLAAPEKNGSLMTVKLIHRAGHSITSTRFLAPDPGPGRNDTQAVGSADSYARRYLTLALWNLVTKGADNDGATAESISQDQCDQIRNLLTETGSSPNNSKFLAWLKKHHGVDSINRIQRYQFGPIMDALEDQRRAKQQ